MYDHIGLRVKDLKATVRFYKAALEPLGHVPDDSGIGQAGGGAHLAFRAADRQAVDRFYAAGVKAGGRDNGKPGLRADSRRSA